jgi:hypothetical protein
LGKGVVVGQQRQQQHDWQWCTERLSHSRMGSMTFANAVGLVAVSMIFTAKQTSA